MLELARIDAGRFELQLGPVEIPEVAGRADRVFAPLAREKGLLFRVEVGDEVPEAIFTDRQRLDQILTNLLGNAIKFTDRGEVALRIHREGPRVAFAVSDTGVGVAPVDQARIFAPFEQVQSSPARSSRGTGLGLAIARELAELLGGELRVESELGQGSTFICVLPMRAPGRLEAVGAPSDAHPG